MKTSALIFHEGRSDPGIRMAGNLVLPEAEGADARLFLMTPCGSAIAHVGMWWSQAPSIEGGRMGTIGAFAASDGEAARHLLQEAMRKLQDVGCVMAVGPMNGNTWRNHRFVTESDERAPFFLEPRNPPPYPAWWLESGFVELSRYSSSVIQLEGASAVSGQLKVRLEKSGVVLRALDPGRFEDELRSIHKVSLKSFSHNFLYTPLEESSFLSAYLKIREQVDSELVRMATREGSACGFAFGIPDLEEVARGGKPALIVKTLAVDPASRCAGLGNLLVDELHRIGYEKGFTEAIHALQHENNTSLKITGRHQGRVFRRYALFSQKL